METVKYCMEVPKESKEMVDAVAAIMAHFVSGKSIAEAALLLPTVMDAVNGYDKVPGEMKSQYNDEAAGYLVHKMWDALKKPAAVE